MNHRPRISWLFLIFLILCALTIVLFGSLPSWYDRPNGPGMSAIRPFGPDATEIDRLSCRTTTELDGTLTLVLPKRGQL